MYVSVHTYVLPRAADVHWLVKDGISVLVVDYEEVIIRLSVWRDELSSLV